MRLILSVIFILTVLVDFTSAAFEMDQDLSLSETISCELESSCDSDSDKHSSEDGHHCHCHIGHSHIAVLEISEIEESFDYSFVDLSYSMDNLLSIKDYLSEIDRPPIA